MPDAPLILADLPDDILEHIISNGNTRVWTGVSKHFLRLISGATRSLTIYIQQEDAILKTLASRGKGVRDLTLPTVTCRIWNALSLFCPELMDICIRSAPVALKSDDQPLPLFSLHTLEIASSANPWVTHFVPNLRSLTLPVSVQQYDAFVPLMPQLERFYITIEKITQEQYDLLAVGLSTASRLHTLEWTEYTPDAMNNEKMLTALRSVLPQLTSMSLVTDLVSESDLLTCLNPQRDQLTKCALNLSLAEMLELNLSPNTVVDSFWIDTYDELMQAASAFQRIDSLIVVCTAMLSFPAVPFAWTTTLSLFGSEGAQFEAMLHTLTLFPNLTSLTWDYRDTTTAFTPQFLNLVTSHCPSSLTRLDMTFLSFDFSSSAQKLFPSASPLHILPNVKDLRLSLTTTLAPTDDLSPFLVLLPNLTSFTCVEKVTLSQLLPLASQLTSLCLSLDTVQADLSVLRQFTKLEYLNIGCHKSYTVCCEPLFEELCYLQQLTTLNLEAVLIEPTSLRRLLTACSRLRSVKFHSPCTISPGCCAVLGELGSLLREIVLPAGEDFDSQLSVARQLRGCCLSSLQVTRLVDAPAPGDADDSNLWVEDWAELASEHAEIAREYEPIYLSVNTVSAETPGVTL